MPRCVLPGHSPLYLAADTNKREATLALLEAGCNPWRKERQRGFTPLHIAAFKGSTASALELLQRTTPQSSTERHLARVPDDANQGSSLHWAVIAGQYEMAKMLIDAGAQPNGRDKQGNTPLHLVNPNNAKAWENKERFLHLLGEHGAQSGSEEGELFWNGQGKLPLDQCSEEPLGLRFEEAAARRALPPRYYYRCRRAPLTLCCVRWVLLLRGRGGLLLCSGSKRSLWRRSRLSRATRRTGPRTATIA